MYGHLHKHVWASAQTGATSWSSKNDAFVHLDTSETKIRDTCNKWALKQSLHVSLSPNQLHHTERNCNSPKVRWIEQENGTVYMTSLRCWIEKIIYKFIRQSRSPQISGGFKSLETTTTIRHGNLHFCLQLEQLLLHQVGLPSLLCLQIFNLTCKTKLTNYRNAKPISCDVQLPYSSTGLLDDLSCQLLLWKRPWRSLMLPLVQPYVSEHTILWVKLACSACITVVCNSQARRSKETTSTIVSVRRYWWYRDSWRCGCLWSNKRTWEQWRSHGSQAPESLYRTAVHCGVLFYITMHGSPVYNDPGALSMDQRRNALVFFVFLFVFLLNGLAL